MHDLQKVFHASPRTLRQFAGLWVLFVGAAAFWEGCVQSRVAVAWGLGAGAAAVGSIGLLRPALLRPLFVAATIATLPLGLAVSRFLLALVFYGLFTPLGRLLRASGFDLLELKQEAERATYWETRNGAVELCRYLRPF